MKRLSEYIHFVHSILNIKHETNATPPHEPLKYPTVWGGEGQGGERKQDKGPSDIISLLGLQNNVYFVYFLYLCILKAFV